MHAFSDKAEFPFCIACVAGTGKGKGKGNAKGKRKRTHVRERERKRLLQRYCYFHSCPLINMQNRDVCKTSGCQIISNQNRISLKRKEFVTWSYCRCVSESKVAFGDDNLCKPFTSQRQESFGVVGSERLRNIAGFFLHPLLYS